MLAELGKFLKMTHNFSSILIQFPCNLNLFAHCPIPILNKAKINYSFFYYYEKLFCYALSMFLKTFSRGVSSPINSPKERRPSKSRSIRSKKSETSSLNAKVITDFTFSLFPYETYTLRCHILTSLRL